MFGEKNVHLQMVHDRITFNNISETSIPSLCFSLDRALNTEYGFYEIIMDPNPQLDEKRKKKFEQRFPTEKSKDDFKNSFINKCIYLDSEVFYHNEERKQEYEKRKREYEKIKKEMEKKQREISGIKNKNLPKFFDLESYFSNSKSFLPSIIRKVHNENKNQNKKAFDALKEKIDKLKQENEQLKKDNAKFANFQSNLSQMNITEQSALQILNSISSNQALMTAILNNHPLLALFNQNPSLFQQTPQQFMNSPFFNQLPQGIQQSFIRGNQPHNQHPHRYPKYIWTQANRIVSQFLENNSENLQKCQQYLYQYMKSKPYYFTSVKLLSLNETTFEPIKHSIDEYDLEVEMSNGFIYHIFVRAVEDDISTTEGFPIVISQLQSRFFKGKPEDYKNRDKYETTLALFWNAEKPSISNCIFLTKSPINDLISNLTYEEEEEEEENFAE